MTMSFTETVIYDHVVQVELLDVVVFLRVKERQETTKCDFVSQATFVTTVFTV